MKKLFLPFLLSFIAIQIQAQGLEKIKDFIVPQQTNGHGRVIAEINNKFFFLIDDGVHSVEPWISDGTLSGTTLLKDINPISSSFWNEETAVLGNTLYFQANDGVNSSSVFKTDGTATNTQLAFTSTMDQTEVVNNKIFFMGQDATNGAEPWVSDGTVTGTHIIKNIRPGSSNGMWYGRPTAVLNNEYYFRASDNSNQINQLWKTDGTDTGTVKIVNGGNPSLLTVFNNAVYFTKYDTTYGEELWKTDGTVAGTVLVKDIIPGAIGGVSTAGDFMTTNNMLYFLGFNGGQGIELWKSDGTTAGTVLVKDIDPNNNGSTSPSMYFLGTVGNILYFVADDGVHGQELWKSDGTAAGTIMLKDIFPGTDDSSPSNMQVLTDGTILFEAKTVFSQPSLWKSDGTAAGTKIVKNNFEVHKQLAIGNILYIIAGENFSGTRNLHKYTPCVATTHTDSVSVAMGDSIFLGGAFQNTAGVYTDTLQAINSCDSIVSTTLTLSTAITQINADLGIEIYPTPTSDKINIDKGINEKLNATIYDAMGQIILQRTLTNKLSTIDLNAYPTGMYFITFSNDKYIHTKKIIKQ